MDKVHFGSQLVSYGFRMLLSVAWLAMTLEINNLVTGLKKGFGAFGKAYMVAISGLKV